MSYELAWTRRSLGYPLGRQLRRRPGARRVVHRSNLIRVRDLDRDERRGLAFSLRPPRWARRIQVGRILGKVAKVGAITAGAVFIAPAAAGLIARGGFAAARFLPAVSRAGGAAFRFGAGKSAAARFKGLFGRLRLPSRAPAPPPGTPTAPSPGYDMGYPTPTPPPPMPSGGGGGGGSMAPSPAFDTGGAAQPEEAAAMGAPEKPGGLNPALIVGGLIVGGIVLASMTRKRRAA